MLFLNFIRHVRDQTVSPVAIFKESFGFPKQTLFSSIYPLEDPAMYSVSMTLLLSAFCLTLLFKLTVIYVDLNNFTVEQ